MSKTIRSRKNQRGAVAVMVGLSLVVLISFMGISVDLGRAYVGTTELQNAADAAALDGAKALNNPAQVRNKATVDAAVQRAINTARRHTYNFATTIVIDESNIRLAACPNAENVNRFGRPIGRDPSCSFYPVSAVTDANAASLTFMEVDTGSRGLNTFFMGVAGAAFDVVRTAGYAVAGVFVNQITPIGICAVDPDTPVSYYTYTFPDGGTDTEMVEYGFRRGVTYDLLKLGPLAGATSDPYLINPVDSPPGSCEPNHSSANFTAPFICAGNSAVLPKGYGEVYTNAGMTASLAASLNSRFDQYGGASACSPATAPPDVNIKEYHCKGSGSGCSNSLSYTRPIDWMVKGSDALPDQEAVSTLGKPKYNLPEQSPFPNFPDPGGVPSTLVDYGVLWSYGPAFRSTNKDNAFTAAQANQSYTRFQTASQSYKAMYGQVLTGTSYFDKYPNTDSDADNPVTNKEPYTIGSSPYWQENGSAYFQMPTHDGVRNRRLLNIVLIDCTKSPVGPASCARMVAPAVGKFFMQIPADFSGGPNKRQLSVEFAGLLTPVPTAEVKLYR